MVTNEKKNPNKDKDTNKKNSNKDKDADLAVHRQ